MTEPSATTIVVRSPVASRQDYQLYREELRFDFWFSCSYCSVPEIGAGGIRFTIDHYEPREARKDLLNEYSNLFWACDHCNQYKASTWPPDNARNAGVRFFRADVDEIPDHYRLAGMVLHGISEQGEFSVKMLRLNRLTLRKMRAARARIVASREHVMMGLHALRAFPVERLPEKLRPEYEKVRRRLEHQAGAAREQVDERALREMNRSFMLDEDPDEAAQKRVRDAYLARQKGMFGGSWTAPRKPASSK
jgi:hypothetical protein